MTTLLRAILFATLGYVLIFACCPAIVLADASSTIDTFNKNLPQIKVKETEVNVSPKMRFYLPSGALDLGLRQEFIRTTVDFSSKYDFVNNFMAFTLDFLYRFNSPYSFGVDLSDRVDFKAIFDNAQYIQRAQSMTPYIQYTLSPKTRLRSGLRLENTMTESVNGQVQLDYGKNIVGEVGIFHDALKEGSAYPTGGSSSLSLQHSFKNLGSNYNYTQAEANLKFYYYFYGHHYLEYITQVGYPIETENRPLTSFYYAGGYRLLRGYNYREFQGDALIYNELSYHVPIVEYIQGSLFGIELNIVTLDFFIDGAKIGDYSIYNTFYDEKFSAGGGFGYKILLLNRFPVQLDLTLAKAFDSRQPILYFTVSTIYYTWGNE